MSEQLGQQSGSGIEGRPVIVTGGGSGLGEAAARLLGRSGAKVVVVDVSADSAARVVADIEAGGGTALTAQADVTDEASVAASVQRCLDEFGTPYALVNSAGISHKKPLVDCTLEEWRRVLDVNLAGSFLYAREVIPGMIEQRSGRVVNLSSRSAVYAGVGAAAYAASKSGVSSLTQSLAREVAEYGITVNAVAPGLTDTPMARETMRHFWNADSNRSGSVDDPEQLLRWAATESTSANPMKVLVEPIDVARMIVYLICEGGRYITGQTIHVNAGSAMP